MKILLSSVLFFIIATIHPASAEEFNLEKFAKSYFSAWTATQSPQATKQDVENYLLLLADDIGHQHLPNDFDDARKADGKQNMRKGMYYYLGAHTEYTGTLVNLTQGYGVIVLEYDTLAKGVHPQTQEVVIQQYRTLEVLEIEKGKVSVIRKYSE